MRLDYRWRCSFAVLVVGLAACSSSGPNPPRAPVVEPAPNWRGDTILAPILTIDPLDPKNAALVDSIALKNEDLPYRLADVVADSTAPVIVRINAIRLLSDRKVTDMNPFVEGLTAADERLRAATVVAIQPYASRWRSLMGMVKEMLNDPSPIVQAKVLETLADTDVDLLRSYAARPRPVALRTIAEDLIRTAEERGAALLPLDSSGVLERISVSKNRLRFRPTTRWRGWDAAVGELSVAAPGKDFVRISDSVEVVRNIVPAFFSVDGKWLVYEANRQIHVRDLSANTDRVVAAGVAPRIIPFTERFVYLKPGQIQTNVQGTAIRYEVRDAAFAPGSDNFLGYITAQAQMAVNGYYSTVRWMRVRETGGTFWLSGDLMDPFKLPNPFASQ
jgi:hypothetical protein